MKLSICKLFLWSKITIKNHLVPAGENRLLNPQLGFEGILEILEISTQLWAIETQIATIVQELQKYDRAANCDSKESAHLREKVAGDAKIVENLQNIET